MENSQIADEGTSVKNAVCLLAALGLAVSAHAQPRLRLKTLDSAQGLESSAPLNSRTPGRSHWLVQFDEPPTDDRLLELRLRGARGLSYVPDSALSVAADDNTLWDGLGIQWVGRLTSAEKISPALSIATVETVRTVVVEFYTDVDTNEARDIVNQSGPIVRENPDLLPNHLLVSGNDAQLLALAGWDEVAYIFPASDALVRGDPLHSCLGALTNFGAIGQSIPLVGDGWDGPGLGSANLGYAFGKISDSLPVDAAKAEITRALSEWSKYVKVSFNLVTDTKAPRTIGVLFASRDHGDGYPFDGRGGVLAHTFYPAPTNPEPIAADMHFDSDDSWQIGADVDVYSIALHEAGHALGLGHSDNPDAVMYPYYRMHTTLSQEDIAAVRELYAPQDSEPDPGPPAPDPPAPAPQPPDPGPTPVPLELTIASTPLSTTAASISLSGSVSGGTGTVLVGWSTSSGFAGNATGSSAWFIPAIPLSLGANAITISARDSSGQQATQVVIVAREQPASPPANPPSPNPPNPKPTPTPGMPDTTAPSLAITSPGTTNVSISAGTITVTGTAADSGGVSKITWSSSTGGSGTANGTTVWSTPPIQLYIGTTTIVIRATDTAGNTSWRSLVVTRR